MRARQLTTMALSFYTIPYSSVSADATLAPETMQHVPISREALIRHYSRFPDPSLTPAFHTHLADIRSRRQVILTSATEHTRLRVNAILEEVIPHGLDATMYKLRCACEEAAENVPPTLATRLTTVANTFETFQQRQRKHVTSVVEELLPHDFRKSIFDAFRARSERADADALRQLVESGGSVREKYDLLWQQQWRRRESLSSIGNATGVWKWLVKFLVGVPQPLLTFAREINAPQGPTEALRLKFGGVLTELAEFAVEINALTVVTAGGAEVVEVLEDGLDVYEAEVHRYVELLEEVITKSPFFVESEKVNR